MSASSWFYYEKSSKNSIIYHTKQFENYRPRSVILELLEFIHRHLKGPYQICRIHVVSSLYTNRISRGYTFIQTDFRLGLHGVLTVTNH